MSLDPQIPRFQFDIEDGAQNFEAMYRTFGRGLLESGKPVDTGHWQALKDVPNTKTLELQNVYLQYVMPPTMEELQKHIKPNLPFAEAQFQDRVSGQPLNPPPSEKLWPWARHNPDHQDEEKKFSHTYPERFWPQAAECGKENAKIRGGVGYIRDAPNFGVRYRYGDLNDVIDLLAREPTTRQAYLPVWFPEDTGAHHGERVPCTLGYHFMMRENKLNINYFMRSCDFLRYFRDDIYMACRLVQWVLDQLRSDWADVVPGTITMWISSLHVFEGDRAKMEREFGG